MSFFLLAAFFSALLPSVFAKATCGSQVLFEPGPYVTAVEESMGVIRMEVLR